MTGRLAGRVALVTGAGQAHPVPGTGHATAVIFAREGARVTVVDLDEGAADVTAGEIEEAGGEALIVIADVSTEEGCRRAVELTAGRWGRLDVLVNNVGIAGGAAVLDVSEETWARVLDVNLKSVLLMSRFAITAMGEGGSIINLSSISASRASSGAAYAASKAAVESLTRVIAANFGRRGIRANSVAPGNIWTALVARRFADGDLDELRRRRIEETALGTEGTAWDVAYANLFLASDESRWITGQLLTVDGGSGLGVPMTATGVPAGQTPGSV